MIRHLVLIVTLLLALIGSAMAQGCGPSNPNCIVPTAPFGTNNNQAASTAFVQQAIAGSGAGNVGGPGASTVGHIATWNNTLGTLLADTPALQIFGTASANDVLAGPTSGSKGYPSFRALTPADIPIDNSTIINTGGKIAASSQGLGAYGFIAPVAPVQTNFAWALSSQGNATVTNVSGAGFSITAGAQSGDNWRIFGQTTPSSPTWTVRAGFNLAWPFSNNFFSGGIVLWNSGGTKLVNWYSTSSTAGNFYVYHYASPTAATGQAFSTSGLQGQTASALVWLYVYYDGTNYNFYWSPDGINKIKMYSESATAYLAAPADHIGIGIEPDSSTTTFTMGLNLFDWTTYSGPP
jgi:hypothetical protein